MQVRVEEVKIETVETVVEKVVIQEKIKEVETIVPYYNETIKEVQTKVTEPVNTTVERILEVPTILEKLIVVNNEVPRVYEIERLFEKVVPVPQIVELPFETPVIVKVNQVIESFRERLIEIPIIHQEILEVPTIEEKVVAVERRDTEIKEVVIYQDKVVEQERFTTKENTVNYIQKEIQIETEITEKIVPVFSIQEKIVEIPYLLEKIVEKIVIMPQVVEVIKYVHEIVEEATLGVAVGVDISVSEVRYKELYGTLRVHFETVLLELRKLRTQTPALKIQIEIIETFLVELDKLIQFPRFYQVDKEVIVEKEVNRPILVPTKDGVSLRNELALSLLVEKLITEIRTIKTNNPSVKLSLDEDLQLIFFSEAFGKGNINDDLNNLLSSYKESQYNKLFSLGRTWTHDHELIVNTILEERFSMANMVKHANLEIEKSKSLADARLEGYRSLRQGYAVIQTRIENLERELGIITKNFESNPSVSNELVRLFTSVNGLK